MSLFVNCRIKISRRVYMNKQTFEYENITVNVLYEKLPTKEDLEEACSIFYKKALDDIKEKNRLRQADSND